MQGWKFVGALPNGKVILEKTVGLHSGSGPNGFRETAGFESRTSKAGRSLLEWLLNPFPNFYANLMAAAIL